MDRWRDAQSATDCAEIPAREAEKAPPVRTASISFRQTASGGGMESVTPAARAVFGARKSAKPRRAKAAREEERLSLPKLLYFATGCPLAKRATAFL